MIRKPKIGFIGSMNSMPMHYAIKFKEDGYDVKYVVEAAMDNYLMRPEYSISSITYPYPDWIKEIPFNRKAYKFAYPGLFVAPLVNFMKDRDVIIFNDYGLVFAQFFKNDIFKIAIFSGSDLYRHCDFNSVNDSCNLTKRAFLNPLKKYLVKKHIHNQRKGVRSCNVLVNFPEGMNVLGDRLISEIMKDKDFQLIRRYDVNFNASGVKYVGAKKSDKLIIFSGVRFLIQPDENKQYDYKGNDIIIEGIAKYYQYNPKIEVHFVEKGIPKDILLAKQICERYGIMGVIKWHQEMPFFKLLELYKLADVCFDQVGNHWFGAIGAYALFMGKPLIANARLEVLDKFLGASTPILNANTADEICNHLISCESYEFRESVGRQSHEFAKAKLDIESVYCKIKDSISHYFSSLPN